MAIQCGEFTFTGDFDSGNLAKVELVPKEDVSSPGAESPPSVDYEFNVWPRPDCAGTEFENGNRTWFYFGMKGGSPMKTIKFNIVNMNRQVKMFSQGMTPVVRCHSTRNQWERIRDKVSYIYDTPIFIMSFKHKISDTKSFTYFAFTYPYSYSDLQTYLLNLDTKFNKNPEESVASPDDIYYKRECVCYSLEGRNVDLLTISSNHNITDVPEPRLPHLFPEDNSCRAKKFQDKKVIFLSARVHPGETPSSFVMTGVINFLLDQDPIAALLRKMYVFKIIPMLNPDGVARGHYRTDTRGVNLNRYYMSPSPVLQPSVYAARSLILYYHYGSEAIFDSLLLLPEIETKVSDLTLNKTLDSSNDSQGGHSSSSEDSPTPLSVPPSPVSPKSPAPNAPMLPPDPETSGLFLYMDFHGHASKKGIFMYGNHFQSTMDRVECMLLPKIMSINSPHFHFHACNFTERIMYLRDRRDGLSREGSGRVAVTKNTGLIRSYTLECNYNTGRVVNIVPPSNRDPAKRSSLNLVPPRYTPTLFEGVGKALGVSILDMTNSNPYSRIINSEYHSLSGLKEWLKKFVCHEAANALQKMKAKVKAKERRRSVSDNVQTKRKVKSDMTSSELGTASKCAGGDRKENIKLTSGTKKKKKKLPPGSSNVLQVRAKCPAVNNIACCSKSLLPVPTKSILSKKFATKSQSTSDVDNLVIKKGPKRIKISNEAESKWNKVAGCAGEGESKWSKPTTSKSEETIKSWKPPGRLEKKILDPKRRKKLLKVKPKKQKTGDK
uniref:Cytosolic carboxypeptidase-like protein 5 n=1 Tax=Cacopsylla melanoneura TaxID=428564 RepID=A0A8D8RLD4_9HEMI